MQLDTSKTHSITTDSRQITPGCIFVAIKGTLQDGHDYINQAISNGATTIVHKDNIKQQPGIKYIQTEDPRASLSELSANLYPKYPKYIMGVTGTSGKSSIVHFIREILKLLKKKSVSIGTLGVLGDLQFTSTLTTPSAIELHQILQKIYDNYIDYTALECSSHGIDQHRLDSVKFTACGFTNFSREHLDYHSNMEEYFSAKKKLFYLMKAGYAVLNTDIPEFEELYNLCSSQNHQIICYGKKSIPSAKHNITIEKITQNYLIQTVTWNIDNIIYTSNLNLVGEFQIYNLSCAIGLLLSSGITIEKIMPLLSKLQSAPGRMEVIATHNKAGIFVDYAHKPDALTQVLQNLKQKTDNNLWIIFGCGGERDKGKRSIMGELACQYADKVIITDDNPRKEDPSSIRKEILKGCNNKALEVSGRAEAIEFAFNNLKPGDNLIIAGKGHENYQILANETIYFSDKETILRLCEV